MTDANKSLDLIFAFTPPAQVFITKDPNTPPDKQLSNKLTFKIANPPSSSMAVRFSNPDGVSSFADIQRIRETTKRLHLSYFRLWFPWGDKVESLTSRELAANITCSPGSGITDWRCPRFDDTSVDENGNQTGIGTYWILYPEKDTILDPGESVIFNFDNIVTFAPVGESCMYIQCFHIKGCGNKILNRSVPKYMPVSIDYFKANPAVFLPNQTVELSWKTTNAKSCTITPHVEEIREIIHGSCSVKPKDTQIYKMTALGVHGRQDVATVTAKAAVHLYPPGWTKTGKVRDMSDYSDILCYLFSCNDTLVAICLKSVWTSSGGAIWSRAPGPRWAPRRAFGAVAFDNKIWVMGGSGLQDDMARNDVWCTSDGLHWTCVTGNAAWPVRVYPAIASFNGKMWIMAGSGGENSGYYHDQRIWSSSDGRNWQAGSKFAQWGDFIYPFATTSGGSIWIYGYNIAPEQIDDNSTLNVLSTTDGTTWKPELAPPSVAGKSCVLYDYNGAMRAFVYAPMSGPGVFWDMGSDGKWGKSDVKIPWNTLDSASLTVFQNFLYLVGTRELTNAEEQQAEYSLPPGQFPNPPTECWFYLHP